MKKYRKPSLHTHPGLWFRRIKRSWTVLIWLAVVVVTVLLYAQSASLSGMTGAVETVAEPVAPIEPARLVSIEVALGQLVKAGDVVARMDTARLDAQMTVDILSAEQTALGYQQDMLDLERRFNQAVDDADASLATARLDLRRDTARMETLSRELARLEDLIRRGLFSERDLSSARADVAELTSAVAAYPAFIATLEQQLADAKAARAAMGEWLRGTPRGDDGALGRIMANHQAYNDAARALFELQKRTYQLRAARDGIVSEILHEAGDVIAAGEPVVRLVSPTPRYIIGFLPESHLEHVQPGSVMRIRRRLRGDGVNLTAVVTSIAPEVNALPGRLSPIQGRPIRGRRVQLAIQGDHMLLPGETVQIEGMTSRWQNILKALGLQQSPPATTDDAS